MTRTPDEKYSALLKFHQDSDKVWSGICKDLKKQLTEYEEALEKYKWEKNWCETDRSDDQIVWCGDGEGADLAKYVLKKYETNDKGEG